MRIRVGKLREVSKTGWAERASVALRAGDLATAERCLREAVRADRSNARHRLHWASVLEELAQYGAAAEQLTEALHLDPGLSAATEQLSLLLSRRPVSPGGKLNALGLRAALNHDNAAGYLISDLAVGYLVARGALRGPLETGRRRGWLEAARDLVLRRTASPLKDPLLHALLRKTTVRHPDLERLLTALRRVLLLDVLPQRFEDAALTKLAVGMMLQCHLNEHVWSVAPEEAAVVDAPFDPADALAGVRAGGRKLLLQSMYKGLRETLGDGITRSACRNLSPPELREAIEALVAEREDLRSRAGRVASLGGIANDTSRRVALQYERDPYPRWSSAHVPPRGEMRKRFGEFFKPAQLAFLDREFDMLVAGCGTGRQAVVAALSLENVRVTAIDLSASSLAYSARMAERLSARNIEHAKADILDLPTVVPHWRERFKIIACTGVLHHMADPFEGWRRLIECLAPGGLMLVGLYSKLGRRSLAALRADPAYPGAGCSDGDLRAFRRELMDRPPGAPGGELKGSTDFYTMSEFRDLVCHVHEHHLTIAQIRGFLAESGLTFRGFWLDPFWLHRFRTMYPTEGWPGRLEVWDEFEQAHPSAFAGMYLFWCDKPD